MLPPSDIAVASELLTADDFYKPAHGHIFEATSLSARRAGRPVTVTALRRANCSRRRRCLVQLQSSTPATSNAQRHARIIESTRRAG
jgi:replicative DNA helicase